MILICCPKCGRKLLSGVDGEQINTKCPECKTVVEATFSFEELHIVFHLFDKRFSKRKRTNN